MGVCVSEHTKCVDQLLYHSVTHTQSLTHTHTHSHSPTHTHTHTHSRSLTHAHPPHLPDGVTPVAVLAGRAVAQERKDEKRVDVNHNAQQARNPQQRFAVLGHSADGAVENVVANDDVEQVVGKEVPVVQQAKNRQRHKQKVVERLGTKQRVPVPSQQQQQDEERRRRRRR